VLAAAVSTLKFDLVVCGSKGLCGGSGYVGPALAEYLGFAQVCSVSSLDFILGRTALTLQRRLDHGDREVVVCQLPAVITVDEGSAEVPYASLPSVLAAQRIGVKVLDLAAVGLKPADARPSTGGRFLNYVQPRPRTKKVPALDTSLSPMQMMQQISGGGGPKKSGGPVEGDPKKVAAEIVRFLASNSLLPKESDGPLH
jgi:electron transfer flavoprotein beta subunit